MKKGRKYGVKTFSLRLDTLTELRKVAEEVHTPGGMSFIVEDAVSSWLNRYQANPDAWLKARGVPVHADATDDI